MQNKRRSNRHKFSILMPLMLASATLHAAGFQIDEISPSLQGTALAGAASATDDVSAMFFNPATLSTVQDTQVYAGASAIMPHINVNNTTASFNYGLGPVNVNGAASQNNISPTAYVPDFYMAWDAGKHLKAGVAITSPWGLSTDYNDDWIGRNDALDSSIESVDIAPTIAYQISSMWSVGAAVHAQYLNVDYSNSALSVNPNDGNNADLSGTSWGTGYTLGVLFTPRSGTHIGLSYRSQVKQNVSGTGYVNSPLANYGGTADTTLIMPAVAIISLSQQLAPKWTLLATMQWTEWSTFHELNATLNAQQGPVTVNTINNWHNTMFYSLGASYQATSKWELRGGVAYDESPITTQYRGPRIPGSDRYWATVGAGYQASENLALDFVYEHIFMQNQSIDANQATDVPGDVIYNSVAADYSGSADILGIGFRYRF